MSDNAGRDANDVPSLLGVSNVDGKSTVKIYADPITHRLLVDDGGGGSTLTVTDGITTVTPVNTIDFTSGVVVTDGGGGVADVAVSGSGGGTVTTVSVVSAHGLAGTVANASTTPAITLSTTINAPALAGDGTSISAATTTGSGSTVVLATAPSISGATITTSTVNGVTLTTAGSAADFLDATGNYSVPSGGGGSGSNAFAWFIS